MPCDPVSRRALMAGACALASAALIRPGRTEDALHVVSLDYGVTTTLLALGIAPVGIADRADWDVWVVEPPLPAGTVDIGDDLSVNLELVAALGPDLIFSTPYLVQSHAALERIASVETLTIYAPGGEPLARSIEATRTIGRLTGREAEAERFLAETEARFDALARRVAALDAGPVALINFMDQRHARIFGRQSLYQNVMDRIGLQNAWAGETNYWGFQTIAIEELGRLTAPDTRLVVFEPVPPDAFPTLARSPLWNALPFVRGGRVATLPGVLMFGMLPSALRFGELIAGHLEEVSA